MGLTMGLSGMFNIGHDVGGFAGPVPDPELLVRWVQNGVFSPRFIMNSWKPGGEVNTPWLHPEALEPIRAAIRFRYRLMPYLYTLMRRAAERGEPVLRPPFYEFEHDPRAYEDCDEFMFGPHFSWPMCVEQGARERRVYLPHDVEGWYDYSWRRRISSRWTGGRRRRAARPHPDVCARRGDLAADRAARISLGSTTSRRDTCECFRPESSRAQASRFTRTTESARVTAMATMPRWYSRCERPQQTSCYPCESKVAMRCRIGR